MKKSHLGVLVVITSLFLVFTLGFFLGRNLTHSDVQVHVSPPPTPPNPQHPAHSRNQLLSSSGSLTFSGRP